VRLLHVRLWQWIALALLAVLAWLVSRLLHRPLVLLANWVLAAGATQNGAMAEQSASPLRLLIAVGVFAAGGPFLWLALPVQRVLVGAEKALAIVAVTWLLLRVLDVAAMRRNLERTGKPDAYDDRVLATLRFKF